LVDRFLAVHGARKRAATTLFYAKKLSYVVRHPGPVRVDRLSPSHLNDLFSALLVNGGRDGRPLSPRTVSHCRRAMHTVLAFAVKEKLLVDNLAAHTEPIPTPKPRAKAPNEQQIAALLTELSGRDPWLPFVLLAMMTGARREELLALRWRDVDWSDATLTIARVVEQAGRTFRVIEATKSERSARIIGLDAATLDQLRSWRARQAGMVLRLGLRGDPDGLVFADLATGLVTRPYEPDRATGIVSRAARRAGWPAGLPPLHGFRHAVGRTLMRTKTPLRAVMDQLGHATSQVTVEYYQRSEAEDRRETADAIGAALGHLLPKPGCEDTDV
jgi:integrase